MNQNITEFNEFFQNNYAELHEYATQLNTSSTYDYDDLLHRSYLKCYNAIQKGNYTGNTYSSYTYVTIKNTYLTMIRDSKTWYDISTEEVQTLVENQLIEDSEIDRQEEILIMSYLVNGLYEFVDKYYDERDSNLFRIYYKLNKKINYKQLSQLSGYSITAVSNVIKKIKQDLQKNYKYFIEFGMKEEELKQLIDLCKETSKLDVITHYNKYCELHIQIFQDSYRGCKCTPYRLKNKIQQWLVSAIAQYERIKNN